MEQQEANKLQALITGAMAGMVQEIVVHVADAATKVMCERVDAWLKDHMTHHLDGAFIDNMRDSLQAASWFPGMVREEVRDVLDDSNVVEGVVANHDFSSAIAQAMRDYDFSEDMNAAVDRHDFDHDITTALDNFDFDEKMERVIDNYDFDDVVDRRLDDVLEEKIDEYDFDHNSQFQEAVGRQAEKYVDTVVEEKMKAMLIELLGDARITLPVKTEAANVR